MGSRYGKLCPFAELKNLPIPARAIVTASLDLFARTDRGVVRRSNDKTMDNRSAKFRDWLATTCGFPFLCCARAITPPQAEALIGAYVDHVRSIPVNGKGDLPLANTLSHHAQAAFRFLERVVDEKFSIYETVSGKPTMVPFIRDKIYQRKKWEKRRDKREPYTYAMLATMHHQVTNNSRRDSRAFLGKLALIFDTQCLGVFTGSRVSEYAQSKGPVRDISRVPGTGLPIAFIASDFVFLSDGHVILPHHEIYSDASRAAQMQITFRHDKSGRNHAVRKYGKGNDWLCPIRAASRILYRASTLGISASDPICAYKHSGATTHRFLRDTDITDAMRQVVRDTYPDERHFFRVNIDRFASHSNRITAAVALSQANMSIDEIAHRLRWKKESVEHYLRETTLDIGVFTAKAILGAQSNTC